MTAPPKFDDDTEEVGSCQHPGLYLLQHCAELAKWTIRERVDVPSHLGEICPSCVLEERG